MKVWKVKYTDIETMVAKRPFFKHFVKVAANSRKEAINRVKSTFSDPRYGRFSASPLPDGEKPDYMFDYEKQDD